MRNLWNIADGILVGRFKEFIDDVHRKCTFSCSRFSDDKECITYKSNLDPERFFVHPKVLEEEKVRLQKRLQEINEHLDMIVK